MQRDWPDDPVVVADGEADTMAGCDLLRARIGKRIAEINARIQHIAAKPATPERSAFVDGLREEFAALVHVRGAVAKRKEVLSQQQADREFSSFYAAVNERYGSEVMAELKLRAKTIHADAKRGHANKLVGSVIPVGAIGGPRQRRTVQSPLPK